MKIAVERSVLKVIRVEGVWQVEYEGQPFGHSPEKAVAEAAARRRAREMCDAGGLCQIQVMGEGPWAA
jgi:hypothetical protein